MLAIEIPRDSEQPPLTLKNMSKKINLQIPLLNIQDETKEETTPKLEEQIMRTQFFLDHEQYRKDTWQPLKDFRDRYDSEKMAENILDASEIQKKKKEFDKLILNSIRLSIMADEHDKVFSYIEMLHFTQSLKLCVKLCSSLQQATLANKVS